MEILIKIFLAWGLASMIIVPYIDSDRRRLEHKLKIANAKLDLYRDSAAEKVSAKIKFESECV